MPLRYTNADKRKAAEKALLLFTGDSNRQLAERMGLSYEFVNRVRREMEASGSIKKLEKVVASDGKEYRQPTKPESLTDAQVTTVVTCVEPTPEQLDHPEPQQGDFDDTEYADRLHAVSVNRSPLGCEVTEADDDQTSRESE